MTDLLGPHGKAILQFSGGKDSLATLYLARPWLDRITVMFGDTGNVYPHLLDFVEETCAELGAKLQIVRPEMKIEDYHARFGLPSDIVPAFLMPDIAWILRDKPDQLLQPTMTCCWNMLLAPMQKAVMESDATLVIRGAKAVDTRRGVPPGTVFNGKEFLAPIWNWTDADVYAYLEREGAELCPHYKEAHDSLDCWSCTGHMAYGDPRGKLAYTKKHYPEYWPELQRRLKRVRDTVRAEGDRVNAVMDEFIETEAGDGHC